MAGSVFIEDKKSKKKKKRLCQVLLISLSFAYHFTYITQVGFCCCNLFSNKQKRLLLSPLSWKAPDLPDKIALCSRMQNLCILKLLKITLSSTAIGHERIELI